MTVIAAIVVRSNLMPVKFDCKTIKIDDVLNVLCALEKMKQRNSFNVYEITRYVLEGKIGDERYKLSDKEARSAEGRVRRILKKEEEKTGRVRNVSSRENKALWTTISEEKLNHEREERIRREMFEQKVMDWLASHGVDVGEEGEYENICITRFEVRIPIEEFQKLMEACR